FYFMIAVALFFVCSFIFCVFSSFIFFFFFFFQAEDGIRDKLVTGVQTCALPISSSIAIWRSSKWSTRSRCSRRSVGGCSRSRTRSEERRVGKECRSRWSPDH